ncbi:hypothetical protein [Chryseobacterium indoltheticum]|uniref:hypothetical protein n=1 Tax=Chryseobacterium indoltheticum TaxID=254 RepID=UPI003F4927E6
MDVTDYKDYGFNDVTSALSDDHIVLKFQKKVKSKREMVTIWYGSDFDLAEHDGFIMKYVQIDWNISTGDKILMTNPGYSGQTAVGNNLYLMNAVDKSQVDVLDKSNGAGTDEIFLWNSLTNKYSKVTDMNVEQQMVISPDGKRLLIQRDEAAHEKRESVSR